MPAPDLNFWYSARPRRTGRELFVEGKKLFESGGQLGRWQWQAAAALDRLHRLARRAGMLDAPARAAIAAERDRLVTAAEASGVPQPGSEDQAEASWLMPGELAQLANYVGDAAARQAIAGEMAALAPLWRQMALELTERMAAARRKQAADAAAGLAPLDQAVARLQQALEDTGAFEDVEGLTDRLEASLLGGKQGNLPTEHYGLRPSVTGLPLLARARLVWNNWMRMDGTPPLNPGAAEWFGQHPEVAGLVDDLTEALRQRRAQRLAGNDGESRLQAWRDLARQMHDTANTAPAAAQRLAARAPGGPAPRP